MKKFTLLPLLFLLFVACDNGKIHSEFDRNFKDNRWFKNDVRTFEFEIEEAGEYSIDFDLGYIFDYPLNAIPITTEMTLPDGKIVANKVDLYVKIESKSNGDCAGDICDLPTEIYPPHHLDVGKYKIKISNAYSSEYLPNILGVGITVKRPGNS